MRPSYKRPIVAVMYGVVVGLLLLETMLVLIAPLADQAWYPLVTVVQGTHKTVYPGPLLITIAMALGLASTFIVPRRYYGVLVVVIVIALIMLAAIGGYAAVCTLCSWYCAHVQSCGIDIGVLYVQIICQCYAP